MRISTTMTRRLTGGPGARTAEGQFTQLASQSETPTLQRAVVIDVITDTALLSDDYLNAVAQIINNPELIEVMPVNAVIARIVSAQGGVGPVSNTILLPFFSSHLMMPVQPGEQVYVVYEDFVGTGTKLGYWFSRIHGTQTVEDPNYTHYDRLFDPTSNPGNYTTSQVGNRTQDVPPVGFSNGGNTQDTLTLVPSGNLDGQPYEIIIQNSIASKFTTPEPVPRWKKRPQEFVLQGANNALIMLGEDRNGPVSGAIQQSPVDIQKGTDTTRQAGAIDIVVGRGRYFAAPGSNPKSGDSTSNPPGAKSTTPLTTTNTRGFHETDKNPFRSNREGVANSTEGDPDPMYDAARVYVVQQSKVDENYRLVSVGGEGISYPDNAIPNIQPTGTGPYGRSYVVAKADNIRVVARREQQTGNTENIAGTILLIREGKKTTTSRGGIPSSAAIGNDAQTPDGNLAYMYFDKDGQIQAEAKKIILGRGLDGKEPYIRWSYYNVQIEELKTQVKALADQVQKITQQYNQAFQAGIAVPWATIATHVATGQAVLQDTTTVVTQIKQKVDTVNPADAKSKKIFGE